LVVACHIAHRYAKEVDKRFPGDPSEMLTWMRQQVARNRASIADALAHRLPTTEDFLAEFESEGNILEDKGHGISSAMSSIKGYCFQVGALVYIPKICFEDWCKRRGIPPKAVVTQWRKASRVFNLGTGEVPRYMAQCPEALKINGKKHKPVVMAVLRTTTGYEDLDPDEPINLKDWKQERFKQNGPSTATYKDELAGKRKANKKKRKSARRPDQ